MKTIIAYRHWKGYSYGNPWEEKAIALYTTFQILKLAVSEGLAKMERVEKSYNGFIYGYYHNFIDAAGQVASIYIDTTFGEPTQQFLIYRDIQPLTK